MHYVKWLVRIVVLVLLVGFVAKNFDIVTLQYYPDFEYQVPLSIVILIAFALGLIIGYLAIFSRKQHSRK